MNEKWVVAAKRADFNAIGRKFGIDPVIARLIRNRDVIGDEKIGLYLNGTLRDLPDPHLLKDAEKASGILRQKIREKKKIRIIGDYDIDGVTSTCILVLALRKLGADVDTCIPHRVTDGYGLHEHLITQAAEDHVDTILTCDNGISASKEIELAKAIGMTVIVTDHHEVPVSAAQEEEVQIIPPADAVIDPKQADCPYPNKNICGAVVAWKLMQVLYALMGEAPDYLFSMTDLAAVATVGDVMDLQDENRIIVKEGLRMITHTRNVGLAALIRACGLADSVITAYHIGFVLGPCINATGRLDTAQRALALLMAEEAEEADRIAGELKDLNESRKAMTEEQKAEAVRIVESTAIKEDRVLVVYLPDCHESIAGIIAGRLREQYYRPAIVLTPGEEMVKGSGRSIEAYHMFKALTECDDLLEKYGGHPMAAGLSIKKTNVVRFRRRLNENCRLTPEELTPKVVVDVPMPVTYISRNLIEQIHLLEPFGKGNQKPVFAQKNVLISDVRILGKNRNVLRMTVEDAGGYRMNAICFGDTEAYLSRIRQDPKATIAYYPEINSYQGIEKIQIIITNID